jgi:hypothetical protein
MEFHICKKDENENENENEEIIYNYQDYDDDDDDYGEDIEDVKFFNQQQEQYQNSQQQYQNNQQQQYQQLSSRQVTYDDILASLNMKVVNGTLQMIQPPSWHSQQQQQQQQQQFKKVHFQQHGSALGFGGFQIQNKNQIPVIEKQEPIHPLQLKRQLLVNHLRRQAEMQRIKQIKSKKLLFPHSNIHTSQNIFGQKNKSYGFHL